MEVQMNTIKNVLFGILLLGVGSSFNVQAVSSGSFKLVDYKQEVAMMMDYIKQWDNGNNDQELQTKVIDWMNKRVKNQDIPAILLLEITQLLSDTQQTDEVKMQAMFDIIQKNKEARKKIKIKRKIAKAAKQEKQQKQNAEAIKKDAASERQRIIRLVKDVAVSALTTTVVIYPLITIIEYCFKNIGV